MIVTKKPLLKSELARKLGMSTQTFYRFIKEREEIIKSIYPAYKTRSQLLQPKVIDYIIEELGYSQEEIYMIQRL